MVYLFHFELPVEEATWTCLATAYWSYLKNLTVSEVDACSASVMHLSRAYDAMGSRLQPSGGGDEGGGAGSETVYNGADDGHSEISFLTFFYVNTKKGIIECGSFASVVGSFDCLFIYLFVRRTHETIDMENFRSAVPILCRWFIYSIIKYY